MRYYGFALKASEELISKNATIKIRDYDYDSAIAAMNKYFYQKRRNGINFLAYREEKADVVLAVFCYEEEILSFNDAYEYILDMIRQPFGINRVRKEPHEITGYEYYECIQEARRRNIGTIALRNIEEIGLAAYQYTDRPHDTDYLHFAIEEMIVPEKKIKATAIYDPEFVKELSNIEEHVNTSELQGNMVHYIISCRSGEVTKDMTEMLTQRLYEAKRIRSRRIVRMYDINEQLYNGYKYFEEMIERNRGGVVVIDLSERFGCNPIDYKMISKFIEKMVKAYRNDCLFVFTYNMDSPGFSYLLLPQIQKYIIPVTLKEGSGDRKAAVAYMKKLIKGTDYAEYAAQAGEFMKQYPGKVFSQTDVIMAHEQFDAWCMNKNILKAYDYNVEDGFVVERMAQEESAYEKLQEMIGLKLVKEQIDKIIANNVIEKERKRQRGKAYETATMHMVFGGNPGSAKTTVAKLFAGIAKEKGILKSGAFVERGGMDLDGMGCVTKIRRAFAEAKGGVLFIDEAYSLQSDTAVTVLIQEMENRREEVIVILAGYNERMQDFMETNEGLKSRIPYWVDFPDYSTQELTEIFKYMMKEKGISASEETIKEAQYIFDKARYVENFGNGRYVRNLLENALQNQSVRLLKKKEVPEIRKKELFQIIKEDISMTEEGQRDVREKGTAGKELDEMIGLSEVKAIIKKAIADFKIKKFCLENGIRRGKPSMHMVFAGNPGTAKTTVARLFAEIMGDEKILPTGKFVEVGRADLVGTHVGATAPRVKSKFREAQGGILFIDEAYALCDSGKNSYGDEAINTIVQEMENHREDTIVVFAGYPEQMQEFLERNPGLSSRIAFHVDFKDYSVDELCGITKLMLSNKKMTITDEAMELLRAGYEKVSSSSDYGNGRFVRKVLEEAEMNLAERLSSKENTEITVELVTTIEACDIPPMDVKKCGEKKQLGFRVA